MTGWALAVVAIMLVVTGGGIGVLRCNRRLDRLSAGVRRRVTMDTDRAIKLAPGDRPPPPSSRRCPNAIITGYDPTTTVACTRPNGHDGAHRSTAGSTWTPGAPGSLFDPDRLTEPGDVIEQP